MDQFVIGKFIAQKRKEKNMTQAQLAEELGVSNKTVSKWECGKCMPDYSIIESLCRQLEVTVSELMDGETNEKNSIRVYDEKQILDLIERTQILEKQKQSLYGIMLIVMGTALFALSQVVGGNDFKDFISGALIGLSFGEMIVGAYIVGLSLGK
ncbi:helix-turn-helix domain-containing protein [Anaerosporobacter sp.]